ncbi:ectopic P granules protein 5 homolog [Xyrauchen texanus]|uniref:ectopic P granules protein 5 homolog n=1 Tax=Xyrauchen texanus TaxID=154827 RepID=UPI002242B9B4|nr:ectopic P granules protein 5 homolog [Xyrauchen texanus]XP_051954096.1 ectopic P granules protein 5 homolog [Xyrauchen texanus]
MEAVRPKKSKSSGKIQVKKERPSEGVRKPSGPSTDLHETAPAPEFTDFTDVPLSLSPVPHATDLNPPTQPSVDHNDNDEKDQDRGLLCDTTEILEKPPCQEDTQHKLQSHRVDQALVHTQYRQCGQRIPEPFSVPSTLPSIPAACSEPQLLEATCSITYGLVDAVLMPLDSEAAVRPGKIAVQPLASQESSPPCLVPVEVADVERLYPELPRTYQTLKPFTSEQLRTWEPGSWLENVELHAAEFQSLAHQEGHELYELLLSYWRCRKQLTQAQTELQAANSDCKNVQNRLWSFKDERLSLQGVCADQAKVFGYHSYQQVTLNEAAIAELKHLFAAKAEILHQTVALHSYTSILSRLQVESYLYHLLSSNPTTKSVAVQDTSTGNPKSQPSSLHPLKESISVLFIFTRRVLDDSQFQTDIHLWLQRLVSVLHLVGSSGDHLFILNHLLCCPAGLGKWAVPFLQIKVLDNPSGVYYFMQALAVLMSPARHRIDFLGHMKPSDPKGNNSVSGPASGNWTLVDEGGEEDEDPETSWMLLSEDDLILLFSQFPFDELFKHILGICSKGDYQPQATTSQKMMKIFAFASSLVELLAVGLQTYNRARYRQFVKRIGHMIRMTLCYVSDHWAQYISLTGVSRSTLQEQSFTVEKLQVEFDHLFLRAVLHVLKSKRLGIWLFMSEMPYGTLSSAMLWKIFYIMQCAETDGLEKLSCSLSAEDCIQGLREPSHQEKFEHWLSEINSSDGICLLTTFAHMAEPRRTDVDPEFVRTIVLEIFEVSYVSIATREIFSKVGRELLAVIASAHPHIISVLLERLRETIDKVGMVSLYLFKELPLHLWMPSQAEFGLIRDWLLNFSLIDVENRLACIILESLNWGFHQNGVLVQPASLHSDVALLVIEAYQKYLTDKPYGGILLEGIKQVSYLANVVRLGQTPESSFNQWAWDLVLRLKLHANEQSPHDAWCPLPSSSARSVPEITDSPTMHPVFKAVKVGLPIGCFLAIKMTTIGHSLEKLCSEGISLLKTLVQSRHLKAVVHILENILPLVYHCQFYLLKNEQFLSSIQLFLRLDSGTQGVTQQVTQKVAQHLIGTSTCENIKLLNSVIQAHILESSRPGYVGAVAVLEFWLQVLTDPNLWHRDKDVLYILDHLCRAAFLHQQEECFQKLLYQQHKSALGYHGDKGLLSSLMGWIVAGNITPSFIEGSSLTGEVWFAWLVLKMESMFEEDSQLRRCVEQELLSNSAYTPDQALKKAQVRLKLQVVPSVQRLMIYRWAQQALVTPADHPLLPLVWQKFLQLYFRQPGPEFGLEVKGCIGRRYFQSAAHLSLLKSLRQRLVEVSDFHHAASKVLKVPCPSGESSDGLLTPGTPITSPELHTEFVRLFNVFALWLDDENLQKQEIYLPSLPKHYDTHRLAKIMQRQQEVWMEHVDIERVQHELQEVISLWSKVKSEPALSQNTSSSIFTDFINPLAARERILTHLRKHDAPQGALSLVPMKAPVPDIPTESLSDEKISTLLIQEDLAKLQHQAKLATVRETQQVALDNELLEVLPQLYINQEDQLSMQLECRGKGGLPCQGPAHITVKYSRMHKLNPVQNQIQGLKSDIEQLQADGVKAPPQSLAEAAVHTENFITALVNAYKLNASPGILKVGIAAFYQIVSFVCEDTQRHPPTRQFLTSCIEILGQVFIRDVQSECKHMLKTILLNRHLCNLLSPYFTPNASPAELVSLYEEVVNTLHTDSGDVIFMLLTKFDMTQWLSAAQPPFPERSRLMTIIHQALCICGLNPEPEVLMPFNIFCKHWTEMLLYQFPDHYSDFLRLLMQSSSEQLLSPDCWRASLRVLGCSSHPKIKTAKTRSILLSPQQVDETIEWLSKFFLKLRLSNMDFRSFGLLSKWGPYIEEVKVFWEDLINYVIDLELNNCSKVSVGSPKLVKALEILHAKMAKLFEPWILVLDTDSTSQPRCSPWLESDATAAAGLVSLYAHLTETLHEKFKDHLLPGQRGALWLHLMHYCETCTSPKMPEYLLYTYHTAYCRLPWKDLHPDQTLMNKFFNVERGSPKSCFLFMGELLCEVNWVSTLSDALSPQPSPSAQTMVVSLLYLMVFLAKEDLPLNKPESPVLNLLGQSSSLPWHLVDFPSYENIMRYVSTHYPSSLVLSRDTSSQQVIILLRMAAGFGLPTQPMHHKDMTLKCQAFLHLMVQFLTSLDQNGNISLASLETEMEKLLEYIALFNPPETDPQQRHMATCSLFAKMLTLLNEAGISTAEGLGTKLHSWVEKRARGPLVLPLLTAACRCLASVRHMARTTEACILSYFTDVGCVDQYSGWGPILVSLQVPELTVEDFIQESLNLGSYLTLYVYILQRLNLEQTLLNEKKTLVLLSSWINQVFPSGPADEAKLFLWWHKVLELLQIQVDQENSCELDTLILTLMAFQNRLAQLGEERLNSGILGAIGLGRKSPLSSRFRVVARSMMAFLLVQVPSESQLRLHAGTELQLSAKAQQALALLEVMPSNKQYSELQVSVNQACQFIKYSGHCLRDSNRLLTLLINALYTDLHYLDIIR